MFWGESEPKLNDDNKRSLKALENKGLQAFNQAEEGGFEPPVPLRGLRFSRPVQSAALPPLRVLGGWFVVGFYAGILIKAEKPRQVGWGL